METDHDILFHYAERWFQREEKTAFPTVRLAARSLGWTQKRVEEAVDGDPYSRMMLTGYGSPDELLGDKTVETLEEEKGMEKTRCKNCYKDYDDSDTAIDTYHQNQNCIPLLVTTGRTSFENVMMANPPRSGEPSIFVELTVKQLEAVLAALNFAKGRFDTTQPFALDNAVEAFTKALDDRRKGEPPRALPVYQIKAALRGFFGPGADLDSAMKRLDSYLKEQS